MRLAVYYSNHDVRIEERPVPEIGPGELLLRVHASGICGSDVMEWYRTHKAPLVLGHEVTGEVVDVGEGVTGYGAGDRVAVAHHVPCNTCRYCRSGHHTVCDTLRRTNFDPGGFAEYVRLPAINVDRGVFPLPASVSYDEGSFTEPLACVLRALRLARLRPGQSVLVIGSGISGLLHVQAATALGAGRIIATDVSPYRLEAARRFGAEAAIHASEDVPARVREINGGVLADLVTLCAGAPSAIQQALRSVERGGSVLFFAAAEGNATVPLAVNEVFWRNEVTLLSSYGGAPADYAEALELIRARRINVEAMITHRLPLAETGLGFRLVAEAGDSIKVLVQPSR